MGVWGGRAQKSISDRAGNFKASLGKQIGTQTHLNIVIFWGVSRDKAALGRSLSVRIRIWTCKAEALAFLNRAGIRTLLQEDLSGI